MYKSNSKMEIHHNIHGVLIVVSKYYYMKIKRRLQETRQQRCDK